jgi:hypothetical protein
MEVLEVTPFGNISYTNDLCRAFVENGGTCFTLPEPSSGRTHSELLQAANTEAANKKAAAAATKLQDMYDKIVPSVQSVTTKTFSNAPPLKGINRQINQAPAAAAAPAAGGAKNKSKKRVTNKTKTKKAPL